MKSCLIQNRQNIQFSYKYKYVSQNRADTYIFGGNHLFVHQVVKSWYNDIENCITCYFIDECFVSNI